MALESEKKPPTPEAPTVEQAPEAPKLPETTAELDELGSAWETLIGDEADRAKQETAGSFDDAPERIGVGPEEATQVAAETGITAERTQAETGLDEATAAAKSEIATETGNKSAEEQEKQAELDAALDELKNLDIEATAQEFFENYYKRGKTDPERARTYQDDYLKKMQRLDAAANARFRELMTNPDEQVLASKAEAIKDGVGFSQRNIVKNRMFEEGTSFNAKWEALNKRLNELVAEARKTGR